ncbi:hypothetical protein Pfo_011191 [Paulownia fortunei]|nr:hypothetical protein Pfo_011191 [Paulownia fortunei]
MVRVPVGLGFIVCFLIMTVASAERMEVRNALVRFMTQLFPGNNSMYLKGWNTSSDPCIDLWEGVSCDKSLSVRKIVLDQLNLTGILDANSLCVADSLVILSLESNIIVGTLPEEISKCSSLTHLYLHGNFFTGVLPGSLSQLSNLKRLDLSDNSFVGELPDMSRISGLVTFLAENNQISGNIPNFNFANLQEFNVSNNNLSGPIPFGNLKRLDVSDNGFSGDIPDTSRISGLLTFLAQNNQLSGGLPKFDFSNLEDFNVSNNNLSGPIPDVGGHFDETSFLGNPGLCGKPLSEACPPSPAKKKGSSKKDYFIYGGYAAIGLIIVCLVAFKLVKKRKTKEKKNVAKEGFQTDSTHDKVSTTSEFSITSVESGKGSTSLAGLSSPVVSALKFEDLLRSPAELIGRGRHGSLYMVTLNEGLTVAVKRIRHWDISMDDFKKRMHRIDLMKHPNVMPILAFYCSRQEKLLVYEFQQSGSLFRLFHGSQNGKSFDWGSRLSIAVKISEALAFMHEGLQADGIAHGNIKSSNILLSTEMEPFISEYGLAEVELQDQSFLDQTDSFQENNSPGAVAQNNAFKADTYSFGIILLELLTGKLVQNNGYDLARWVNSTIRAEWTVEVFDKALVSEGANEERMVSLLQVARKCINSSSEARPSIREVVGMINSIKEYEEKSITSDPR